MIGKAGQNTNMNGSDAFRSDNIASKLIIEDHLKGMLAKSQNTHYKPWNNKYAPKNPHSPFGDFPKSHINKSVKGTKLDQVHENSQAATLISKQNSSQKNV